MRKRYVRVLGILFLLTGVLYVLISLYLPSPRRLIFGVDKNNGEVRLAEQNITYLPPHRFYRMSFEKRGGAAQKDGVIVITSKEGVPLKMTYRLRFSVTDEKIPDADRLVREGWSAWLNARVGEAVSAVTSQIPVEDLVSPLSEFSARRNRLRETVARHLARSGLAVSAFEIERLEADREALLRHKRAELRRNARGATARVAVIAIEGADWELITELMFDGRIPNLRALMQAGAVGSMQTVQPTVAPLLWTTASTGLAPDRHGVIDFFKGGSPIDARSRHVPAVWDVASSFGRTSALVNWWTAWPPVSSGVAVFDAPQQQPAPVVAPESFAPRVRNVLVPPATINYGNVARFLNITGKEYEDAVTSRSTADPINIFRNVLAKTWSDHRAALELYRVAKPSLLMVNYEGTDTVNHLFAPFHPPYREGISQVGYRRYWPAVANYYAEIDRLIGEWMRTLSDDTTVMILSAHGARWGKDRPRSLPSGASTLSHHRNPGIFIAYGNHVVPSRIRRPLSLYDVTPTILALLGLPASREMQGQVATWPFRNVAPIEGVNVVSYSELATPPTAVATRVADMRTYRSTLQQIGHVTDPRRSTSPLLDDGRQAVPAAAALPPEKWGLYAYFNNLGVQLKQQKKTREAIDAWERAIELNPSRATPYYNVALLLIERQQYTAAETLIEKAIVRGVGNPEKLILDIAAHYRERDMATRAVSILIRGRNLFPQSHAISANLASALAATKRYTEATAEFERALSLQPSSTLVLNNLGLIYLKKQDYGRTLDYWNRSLSIEPRQPKLREAVAAVRTHL